MIVEVYIIQFLEKLTDLDKGENDKELNGRIFDSVMYTWDNKM